MTDKRSPDERQALAAEQALRLLTGAECAQAAALERDDDAAFAGEVARWRGRFAPLINEVAPVAPPAGLWGRIEQAALQGSDARNVVVLRRSRSRWRAAAAAMTAIAAALALILVEQPRTAQAPVVAPPARGTPMVAMLGDGGKSMKVVASWDPSARQLVLAVSGDMPSDPAHAHQLWVIPSDGKPRSLGTMAASKQMHMRLADALARLLQQGATIAISVEPPGGSPTGQPTGPVVASGALKKA